MSILNQFKSKINTFFKADDNADLEYSETAKIVDAIFEEVRYDNNYYYGILKIAQSKTYQQLKAQKNSDKVEMIFNMSFFLRYLNQTKTVSYQQYSGDLRRKKAAVIYSVCSYLLRQKLQFDEEQLLDLINLYFNATRKNSYHDYPIALAFRQLEKHIKANGMSDSMKDFLIQLSKHRLLKKDTYYGTDFKKIKFKITGLLNENSAEDFVPLINLSNADALGEKINLDLDKMPLEERKNWCFVLQSAIMVNGGKPTKKYLNTVKPYITALGRKYKTKMWEWLELVCHLKNTEIEHNYLTYSYTTTSFLEVKNANLLKGLVWTLVNYHDKKTLDLLARLTERAFKKIPGVGPAAAALGNACIYTLAQSKGLVGISHLSRLKLKIQQNNTRKLIEKYVTEQSQKLGVSAAAIEDLAVPDYGLKEGKKVLFFEDYQFEIEVISIGKVQTRWIKPDGKIQKSVPAFVKQNKKYSDKLKAAKAEIKLIQKYLTAQRDRIDRNYIQNRKWTYAAFKEYYLEHGLMSFMTKKLIWNVILEGGEIPAFYKNGTWQTIDNQSIKEDSIEGVTLWHPVEATTEAVLAWRDQLTHWQIKQPFKQAYREVYILTDAEVNTRLYSNRMAAHILKQHQFNALAGLRGWKYSLMGAYDDGRYDEVASINIPAYGLSAEFWIGELNEDGAWNDTGIWNYVTTDQVRFKNENDTLNLIDVPKLVFSEIMRDVDMFVGVASVGNDPQWQDNGGLRQHHDYWQSYSFGNLSEMAKTRKAVLEKLIPRLKIRDKATIDGKFLKVKGKLRTYKIHIGSTNILMEPNDQYLCIVPSRGKDTKTEGIFLPFEGDRGLSVILSKAFMLAEDDKIKDSTITSQIKRKI